MVMLSNGFLFEDIVREEIEEGSEARDMFP